MNALRLCLLLGLAAVPSLTWGQHVLLVPYEGKARAVVDAHDFRPVILLHGKLRETDVNRFNLVEGGEYVPLFVAVRHPQLVSSFQHLVGDTEQMNRKFRFSCELESAHALKHVFLVVTFEGEMSAKGLLLYGVGELEPRQSRRIDLVAPTDMRSQPGHFQVHLFSGGRELFQSMMPERVREAALDKIVHERIKGVKDSPPRPLVGPAPEYPSELRKNKVDGQATISFLIRPNGSVVDPQVVSASRPEFGEAAAKAILQWRFLPKMAGGRPVETRVQMPFEFKDR